MNGTKNQKEPNSVSVQVNNVVIRLIDTYKNPPKDFYNKPCLIKYVNYDDVKWMIANAFHDDCFWFEDDSLPTGLDWIQEYAFLDATDLELEQQRTIDQIEQHRDILAMHMAEVKAIADGSTKNTLNEVVEHCLKEISELGL